MDISRTTAIDANRPFSVTFVAGLGPWRIDRLRTVVGEGLPAAPRAQRVGGPAADLAASDSWRLRAFTSNARYTRSAELTALSKGQEGLGRPAARSAALIPIRKSSAWWRFGQDGRRAVFEEQSHHIRIGQDYLPGLRDACIIAATSASPLTS